MTVFQILLITYFIILFTWSGYSVETSQANSLRCYWWRNAFVLFCSDYRIVFVCLTDAHYRERNNFITLFLQRKLWRSHDETLLSIIESITEWVSLTHCTVRLQPVTKRLPVTDICTLTLIRYKSLIYTY